MRAFAASWAFALLAPLLAFAPPVASDTETTEHHEGLLAGGGLGLHIAKVVPWRADHTFEVGPGVASVTARLSADEAFALEDIWVGIVGPDREAITRSPSTFGNTVEATLTWPMIEAAGPGGYSAVVECGFCTAATYELDLTTRWAAVGANLTVDDPRLLVVPGEATRTGFRLVNTGAAAAAPPLAAEGLPPGWALGLPSTPPVASHASFAGELALTPPPDVAPGTRIAFDLIATDGSGTVLDRVPMEAAYDAGLAALEASSNVVIALVEFGGSGINPYHEEFRGPRAFSEHPAWFVDAYPERAKALPLTLTAATYDEAFEADRAVWESVRPDTLYYVPGTRIAGFICITGCPFPALDTGGHGTGTASLAAGSTLGEAPDALIVSVTGEFFKGARWAARQPWIDVVSMSLGLWLGTCTVGVCDPIGAGTGNPYVPFSMPWAQRIAYESGKRFFTGSSQGWSAGAAGQGVAGPCPYPWASSFGGTPWTFTVETYWPWTELPWRTSCFPPDVVAQGADLVAASALSFAGTNGFGNPSGATPQAAGAYANVVHAGRKALGATEEGPRRVELVAGTSAYRLGDALLGTAAAGHPLPAQGPLSDGVLTTNEAEAAFLHGLEPVNVVTSYLRHGDDPRWTQDAMPVPPGAEYLHEGYGLLTDLARGQMVDAVEGSEPGPLRPADDALYAASFAQRLALWEPHVAGEIWVF